LIAKSLEGYRRDIERGDSVALREAVATLLFSYAPPWLIDAWQQANPRSRREELRAFVVYLISQFYRRQLPQKRTRQRAFTEAAMHVERSARWVQVLFYEPASRPWRKLFRLPERQR
jgi:hypothetical protein